MDGDPGRREHELPPTGRRSSLTLASWAARHLRIAAMRKAMSDGYASGQQRLQGGNVQIHKN
jgi:hypothetical protein